jgi:hypothetical protein
MLLANSAWLSILLALPDAKRCFSGAPLKKAHDEPEQNTRYSPLSRDGDDAAASREGRTKAARNDRVWKPELSHTPVVIRN